MKISFVLVCTCAVLSIERTQGSAIGDPFYPLNPEDLSEGDIKELELLDEYYNRPKRTLGPPDLIAGSAGFLKHLTSAALAGTKYKIGAIVSGSAGAVGAAFTGAKVISGAVNHLKTALLTEATKKAVGVAAGVATGAAGAVKGLKTAALAGIGSKIWQLASASAKSAVGASAGIAKASTGAVAGSVNAVKQVKIATLSQIGKAVGALAIGSSKAVAGASSGIALASAGAIKHVKTAAIQGIVSKVASGSAKAAIGLATAGSAAVSQGAKGLKGSALGFSNLIYQLKSALLTAIAKSIGLIATGSVKAVAGASLGLKTKIGQVAGNIAAGSADAVVQLKHAAIAGTKKKLGQAASGLAGAVTGAVGSASAGAGQIARDAFFGSANLINQLKTAAIVKTKDKIGQIATASAGLAAAGSSALVNGAKDAAVGSASAVAQIKTAAVAGIAKKIGQVASASAAASAGAAAKASTGIGQLGIGAVKGSIDTVNQIKTAAVVGTATKIGQVAKLSAGAVAGTSAHVAKTAATGPKRSESAWSSGSGHGSADIVNQLKSAVVSGLAKKIGQVAKGSAGAVAGASAGFSKGSFSGDGKGYHHSYDTSGHGHGHDSSLNVWELKKSVFNTILQAIKAINGGVLAIKGQLIKGSGYVVAGSGKLLAAGGDKVSDLGKSIISKAVLVHPHKEHHVYSEHGHHSASYTAPSGPPVIYDSPPVSGPAYESHYESPYDHHSDKPVHGSHSGLLILKKIPTQDTYHTSHSSPEESRIPAFKPLASSGAGFGSIVGKFFTASTSLNPTQPTSFGDTAHGDSHYAVEETHGTLQSPAHSYYEEPRTKLEAAAPPSFQAPLASEHHLPSTSHNAESHVHPPSHAHIATSYASPFEESPNFLSIDDHLGASSNINEQRIKLTKGEILDHLEASPTLASSEIKLPKNAPQSLDALKNSLKSESPQKLSSSEFLSNNASPGKILFKPSSTSLKGALFTQQEGGKHSLEDISFDPSIKYSPTYSRFKKTSSKSSFSQNLVPTNDNSMDNFLPNEQPQTISFSKEAFDGLSSAEQYQKYLEHFPFHKVNPRPSSSYHSKSSKQKSPQKLRMQSDHRQRRPSTKGSYSVVKSVSYELTPEGAKRLT